MVGGGIGSCHLHLKLESSKCKNAADSKRMLGKKEVDDGKRINKDILIHWKEMSMGNKLKQLFQEFIVC